MWAGDEDTPSHCGVGTGEGDVPLPRKKYFEN